jgi:hypothetical protein
MASPKLSQDLKHHCRCMQVRNTNKPLALLVVKAFEHLSTNGVAAAQNFEVKFSISMLG